MSQIIYYVKMSRGGVQLVRAESSTKARDHVLKVVTVRKATQDDMLLALPPDGLKIEEPAD